MVPMCLSRWHSPVACTPKCSSSISPPTGGVGSPCLPGPTPSTVPTSWAWNWWVHPHPLTILIFLRLLGEIIYCVVLSYSCLWPSQAHGFEILCSKCRQPSSVPDAPISCNPLWKGFLNSLKKKGYFRVSHYSASDRKGDWLKACI